MVLVEARAKRWGNSLGVIIPKDIVEQEHIHEDERIDLLLVKDSRRVLKETFGMFKNRIKKPTSQIMAEIRKELYD
ncbi:MAG TPA: AbrB/MazE/SpoVT family DNA-binding domain-containing protein [Candidatus Nanoarchaeia archaeon]|nr:AbrB/MazE/SpoVT family DNA-binding domain-containing protein [Candidatus Nanoarchaeia archaeon]